MATIQPQTGGIARKRFFASDNTARVHERIMAALSAANEFPTPSYGEDIWTVRAVEKFREIFGAGTEVRFVYNGTGANVTGLSTVLRSHHAVLTTETAHIREDECGAVEKFTGAAMITVPSPDGKLDIARIEHALGAIGNPHRSQPRIVSITQSTELGTVYRPEEIARIAEFAHENGMYLHMDGARIANAAEFLGLDLPAITSEAGVDILSFGGTKNGMMFGEAVVFFTPDLAVDFPFIRKQGMQLASKQRYISAQFLALLTDGLWLENARRANEAARFLAQEISKIPGIKITREVESNAVFVEIPAQALPEVMETNYFYIWDDARSEARLMASYDTTREEILGLAADLRRALGRQ